MTQWHSIIFAFGIASVQADDIEKISLPLNRQLQRADLYFLKLTERPVAILVLCPRFNENSKDWIENPVWQTFAREHNLDLVGLFFASDGELLKQVAAIWPGRRRNLSRR
jgi:hypothetical protein